MSISLEEFAQHYTQLKLMSAEELAAFQEALPPERRPRDVTGLARELVRADKLTKYQAAAIYQGKTKGLVFGEYTVLDKIGGGEMGKVYKAIHRHMERLVAIKALSAKALAKPDAIKRFHQEAKVAAKLTHNNIVITFDAGERGGVHYLVMEYVDGKDLASIVKKEGPFSEQQSVDYIIQAARGLEYAHSRGVVHRDVKPGNLLLDSEGTIKVLDMGLARIEEPDVPPDATPAERLTQQGQILGTVDYMSPEQAMDTRSADQRSDIYSLGCTLYRILAGKPVFEGSTPMAKLMAHVSSPPPSLGSSRPGVSPALDAVFQKMVAKKPEQRYQAMAEAIAALQAYSRPDAPVGAAQPVAPGGTGTSGDLSDFFQHRADGDASPTAAAAGPPPRTHAAAPGAAPAATAAQAAPSARHKTGMSAATLMIVVGVIIGLGVATLLLLLAVAWKLSLMVG